MKFIQVEKCKLKLKVKNILFLFNGFWKKNFLNPILNLKESNFSNLKRRLNKKYINLK